MIKTVPHGQRSGVIDVPASKSQAHRALICAALSSDESSFACSGLSKDISATINCLRALGADIRIDGDIIYVKPLRGADGTIRRLYCGESGSTLRFLLPAAGALGVNAEFIMEGRLPERPMEPLVSELTAHGMTIARSGNVLSCSGRLSSGAYKMPGDISSQFISGLLMALPLLDGDSTLRVEGKVESAGYITMTEDAMRSAGVEVFRDGWNYNIIGGRRYCTCGRTKIEGDWSGAAFFLCIGALSEKGAGVSNLSLASGQGDRAVLDILRGFGAEVTADENGVFVRRGRLHGQRIDASGIPDLVPIISVVAAGADGVTEIYGAGRLRYKESDRLMTTAAMLSSLGADIKETDDGLLIRGSGMLRGGTADSFGDHRIAMSAAAAACISGNDVEITGAECTEKSYPGFWKDIDGMEVIA